MKKNIILLLLLLPFTIIYADEYSKDVIISEINTPSIKDLDISWDNMEFTYVVKENYEYDINNHKYIKNDIKYWETTTNNIKINNKSVNSIKIKLLFNNLNSNIKGKFNNNSFVIKQNEEYNVKLEIDGYLKNDSKEIIGTIEVVVS